MVLPKRYAGGLDALRYDAYIRYDRFRNRRELAAGSHEFQDTLFIHIPKCAGISIRRTLGIPNRGHRLLCDFAPSELNAAKRIVFCTRDPFDRAVSAFQYLHRLWKDKPILRVIVGLRMPEDFGDFVHDPMFERLEAYHYFFRSQFQYLKGIERLREKAIFLRFETLGGDFHAQFGRELPQLNAGDRTGHSPGIDTPANRDRVRSVYRADYELLPKLLGG